MLNVQTVDRTVSVLVPVFTNCRSSTPDPEWASINHGCVLCIECSGIHRKMGAHVSRIRSLTLDEWRYNISPLGPEVTCLLSCSAELVAVMLAMGNTKHHLIWEARRHRTKPTPTSTRDEREAFIRAKYISKEYLFVLPPSSKDISQVQSLHP